MKTKSRFIMIAILFVLALIVSACGNDDTKSGYSDEKAESGGNSEVTIDSKMGEVTIPADVERVLAPYHEDALLALGVTPVAKWAIGTSVQDYLEPQLEDVPSIEWNLPLEKVLEKTPELIILESNLDSYEGSVEDYQKIADATYVMTEEVTDNWRKQVELFGKMLGKEEKAEEVLTSYDEKVANAKKKLSESIGDETIAAIWVAGDQFYLFEQNRHSAEVLYSELGINQPEFVKSLGEADLTQWNALSMEKLSELKADHIFLLALEGEQGIETLKNSKVWQSIPAAKNDHVYIMNDPSFWTNKGLIASEKTIDAVVDTLVK
ncbi:ABC transporter substrate-binding protein [Virgibacillus oceani]|uniref:Ferrichrome ABC transporter substrate-binding protein n=1 Tax=Virgibacillus oceani TaxID=1479511 RepID=A0A917HCX6_9BACI|nr:ABC transporter substrate-binding protein [Virgibacillus oceani]GGG75292.1 ferrichrome ABC transporter substrate-binding protein [Virgibacillus oceani]